MLKSVLNLKILTLPSAQQYLETLYLRFGAQHGLKESQCALFMHKVSG